MRALILTTVLVTLFSQHALLAQEQGKPPVSGAQATQEGGTGAPAKSDSQSNDERRVMERLGPGMDWDHRKAGRDLQISPRRQGDDVNRERD
jgi:hypothetical protein